jgi:acetyltransferase-like isoleucine patch superfamily enzyme
VKTIFWDLKAEMRLLWLWLLSNMPLQLGVRMRAWWMPRFLAHLGSDTILQHGLRVITPEKVSIGSHCNLGQGAFITGGGGVRIGDWVGFGPDVKVWSVNHRFDDPDTPWQLQGWEAKEVVIEDDVWLGANVFVMPGVIIHKGAIISAGTVVNKSIPAFALVAGNPGRVVGWRKRPADAAAAADGGAATTPPASATTHPDDIVQTQTAQVVFKTLW